MGRSRIPYRTLTVPLGIALALALGMPAAGQTAPGDYRDFKLPTKPAQAPPVVGPTDGDVPAPRQAAPTPAPSRAPAPTISLPPPPVASRAPAAPRPAATAAPRPVASQPVAPADTTAPTAAPTTGSGSLFPSAPASSAVSPDLAPTSAGPSDAADGDASNWWLWPLLAAVLAVLGGLGWAAWRRRSERARTPPEFVRPRVPALVTPETVDEAAQIPVTPAAPVPVFAAAAPLPSLKIALDATRMSATLINATLTYRLVVTNTGTLTVSDLAVAGDMISAHASVSNADMLGASDTPMPVLHHITALAPGESVTLTGDIRLPLAAITPIRRGEAQLFVPLARFRTSGTAASLPLTEHSAFLVGQEPEARAKLQPFRLDLGPRLYSQIGQRPIVIAA